MKIAITGANGLVGQKLVQLLGTQPDVQTLATGLGPCRILNLPANATYSTCDITHPEETKRVLFQFSPDFVIHSAALTNVDECELNPEKCHLLNVEATKNVISACEKTGAHLIHLSTDFIFDGSKGPLIEEDEPNPISIYGQSKLDAEKLVQASNIPWAIARTILVYGIAPGLSRSNIILWVKASLESGKKIQVVDDQFRTPTLAEDLADGCFLIAKNKAIGIFNISGKELMTPFEMAMATCDHFHLDKSLITKASALTFSQPAKRPPRTGFNISKAEQKLGYKPHTFAQGIQILASQIDN
jgi:dTDP-4-dehydrorhamnose reductase